MNSSAALGWYGSRGLLRRNWRMEIDLENKAFAKLGDCFILPLIKKIEFIYQLHWTSAKVFSDWLKSGSRCMYICTIFIIILECILWNVFTIYSGRSKLIKEVFCAENLKKLTKCTNTYKSTATKIESTDSYTVIMDDWKADKKISRFQDDLKLLLNAMAEKEISRWILRVWCSINFLLPFWIFY